MKKCVFFVSDTSHWGPFRQLELLLQHGSTEKISAEVVQVCFQQPSEKTVKESSNFRFRQVVLPRHNLFAFRQLEQLLRLIDPDTIFNWCGGPFVNLAARRSDCELVEIQFDRDQCRRNLSWKRLTRQPDLFVTNDSQLVEQRFGDYLPSHVEIIAKAIGITSDDEKSHGVARERLRSELKISGDAKVVTSIAPLVPASSLKDLIWANDLLFCIRHDVHLLIVGRGPQLWRLQRFARTTESKNNVHFLDDLGDLAVIGADCFWNTLDEGEPEGVLAAMANGIPVVSTIHSPDQYLLQHQRTVLGVERGRRDQFARWTKYVLEQPEPIARMTRQAQDLVLRTRRNEIIAEKFERVLLGEMSGHPHE
jgi:glycosyltransferase involved in cell wall biosynthesis